MSPKKIDAVIESVRYTPDGKISQVRLYPRVGDTYADRQLLTRDQLLALLKAGKRVVVGQRVPLMASTFHTGSEIKLVKQAAGEIIAAPGAAGERDELPGALAF